MFKLVFSSSESDKAEFDELARFFVSTAELFCLKRGLAGYIESIPVAEIKSLNEIDTSGDLIFVVGESSDLLKKDPGVNVIHVVLRTDVKSTDLPDTLLLDNYLQLKNLAQIDSFSGMKKYLKRRSWSESDFKESILDVYGDALSAMRERKSVAVFGAQRLGESVMESLAEMGIVVESFLDNSTAKQGGALKHVQIKALDQITDKETPVIIATTRFTSSIMTQLESAEFKNVLPYSVMSLVDSSLFPDEIPYIDIQKDLAEDFIRYLELFLTLSDDKSREVLDGLIQYRMNYDPRHAERVSDDYNRQYFDVDLIRFDGADVFVDLGGFDGDTVEKFIQFSNSRYKKIYMFEPDQELLDRASLRLRGARDVEYIPAGAYSSDGELRFSASGRTNGAICDDGELVIAVNKVDTAVKDVPTLLKMDIEGSEADALSGARQTIIDYKPKLAVAAYHYGKDLWHLADVIRDIRPDYRFYLRHYSETGLESVLYAI